MQSSKLRQAITNTIVQSLLDGGLPPWRQPWRCSRNAGSPVNVVSKRPYSGVNPLLLQISAQRHNFQSRHWATFAQWKQLRGSVMRRPADVAPGQWGTTIAFCRPVTKTETAPDGDETESKFWVLRSYTVFNIDQVEGKHLDHLRVGTETLDESEVVDRFEEAERIVAATNADIRFGLGGAFYNVASDYIQMPHRNQFSLPEFYETMFHEMVHWTEAPHRLNWDRKLPANTYACGELIAELGGCFLASEVGLPVAENMINHLAYLQNWIETMQTDPKFIFKVAAQASRAVDFILSFSRSPEEVEQPADELVLV
jgi:antirestriction protein ArdC